MAEYSPDATFDPLQLGMPVLLHELTWAISFLIVVWLAVVLACSNGCRMAESPVMPVMPNFDRLPAAVAMQLRIEVSARRWSLMLPLNDCDRSLMTIVLNVCPVPKLATATALISKLPNPIRLPKNSVTGLPLAAVSRPVTCTALGDVPPLVNAFVVEFQVPTTMFDA